MQQQIVLSKVPEITLGFWIIKIFATNLGETDGAALSMSMGLGYLISTAIFAVVFGAAVAAQIRASRFRPFLFWVTVIATTTVGTSTADFADRSLGTGYAGGATILLLLLLASLFTWNRVLGSVSVTTATSAQSEIFYWVTIMFSQTLGTALGDWTADSMGRGYLGSAGIFCGLPALPGAAQLFHGGSIVSKEKALQLDRANAPAHASLIIADARQS